MLVLKSTHDQVVQRLAAAEAERDALRDEMLRLSALLDGAYVRDGRRFVPAVAESA